MGHGQAEWYRESHSFAVDDKLQTVAHQGTEERTNGPRLDSHKSREPLNI